MINVANLYNKELENISFNSSYDIRIHGVQTALSVMGYTNREYINSNELIYGYFCMNTENMIKSFQGDVGLPITGKLDTNTWSSIFSELVLKHDLVVIKTGNEEITLYDFKKFLDSMKDNNDKDNGLVDGSSPNELQNFDDLSFGYLSEFDNDLSFSDKSYTSSINNGLNLGEPTFYNKYLEYLNGGGNTSYFDQIYRTDNGRSFDEFAFNYIVSGGRTYGGFNYNYNLNGRYNYDNATDTAFRPPTGSSNRDYNYVYNLLANSIYNGEFDRGPLRSSLSNGISIYNGDFTNRGQYPYFDSSNIEELKRQKFDIEIHYGQKGETARKIIEVSPISVTQEVNESGEPIFDVYEFIAKDLLD